MTRGLDKKISSKLCLTYLQVVQYVLINNENGLEECKLYICP